MAAVDILPAPSFLSRIAAVLARTEIPEPAASEDHASRRSFILEMMDECPDAFASEEGVRGAMYYFSGRF